MGVATVFGLLVEADAGGGELVDDRLWVVGGAVVDDLDLHLVGAGVLREHGGERLAKVAGAVVGRNHHRPERTVLLVCRRSDWTSERPGSLRIGKPTWANVRRRGSFEKQLGEAGAEARRQSETNASRI